MQKHVLIISDTPEEVIEYLKEKGLDIKIYGFNPVIKLSDLRSTSIENGQHAWKYCDNFIKGIEGYSFRGWEKFECKKHQGEKRYLWEEEGTKLVTDNNPKGETDYSYIECPSCRNYSPTSLEGRKDVLIQIGKQYERQFEGLKREIESIEKELKKQTSV